MRSGRSASNVRYVKWTSGLALLALCAACGGGGGGGSGGGNPPPPPPPNQFAVSPSKLSAETIAGESAAMLLTLTPTRALADPLFFFVEDSNGVVVLGANFAARGGSYEANLSTSPELAEGRHSGSLRVSVCHESPCMTHVSGSPVSVSYDINVVPPPPPPNEFVVSPSTLSAEPMAGDSAAMLLTLTPTQALDEPLFFTIDDSSGVFVPGSTFAGSGGGYIATVSTSPDLPEGRHTGSLRIDVCHESPCVTHVSGSPVSAPYDINVTPPPPALTVDPGTLQGRFAAGFPFSVRVSATSRSPDVYVRLGDPAGAFEPDMGVTQTSGNEYSLVLYALQSLSPGRAVGTVSLEVCSDQPCSNPVRGSPVLVPFDLMVEPLSELSPWPGLSDWETYQGNASHTGSVAVSVDASAIVPRWAWWTPAPIQNSPWYGPQSQLSIRAGRVFVSVDKHLRVLDEHDGKAIWSYDFNGVEFAPGLSSVVKLNPPAASGDSVFVATSGHEATFMWGFEAGTGTLRFKTPFEAQWEAYLAPTVDAGVVFTNGGYYGGMYAFDAVTGDELYFRQLLQYDEWTPAVDSAYAYAYAGGRLDVMDRFNGQVIASMQDPTYDWLGYSMHTSPVIGSPASVTAVNVGNVFANALVNFDTVGQAVRWTAPGVYAGTPAYAGGVLFAVNESPFRLEARNEVDGSLIWWWVPQLAGENTFVGDVLVTENLVFVSTNLATYAIDRSSHAPVWSYPKSGRLALSSSGVFYISALVPGDDPRDPDIVALDVK